MALKTDMADINKSALLEIGKVLLAKYPSLGSRLNNAQYRAFSAMYSVDTNIGRIPSVVAISLANGVGKTHGLILDMIGWCLGSDYVNKESFPPEAIAFYDSLAPRRDKGQLTMRVVCDANDMRGDGSIITILQTLFPSAKPVLKDQLGVFKQIACPHPTIPGVENIIAVKTFQQAVVSHSGSTCAKVWINEVIPDELVGETLGRIRSKHGDIPGAISMFATLLDSCAWVSAMEDDPDSGFRNVRGHIFENVVGKDVTDDMAREVKRTIGVTLEKDPNGGYKTNGVLNAATVRDMIKKWEIMSPHEVEARKCGAPIAVGGKIYTHFKQNVHVVSNYSVNPDWPVIQVVDPHAARPSYVIWAQITPHDKIFIFREWPDGGNYESLSERRLTIREETEVWANIEREYKLNVAVKRLGDPNRFREPDAYDNTTLWDKYDSFGFRFDIDIKDDIRLGHEIVNARLYCDEVRLAVNPEDTAALPRLFVAANCLNTIKALRNYAFKKGRRADAPVTESVNQKYKDGADVVRYLCMYHDKRDYEKLKGASVKESDYSLYNSGRRTERGESTPCFANGYAGARPYSGFAGHTFNKFNFTRRSG